MLLYPAVSNYINSLHQSQAISSYNEAVSSLSAEEYHSIINEAHNYNNQIRERNNVLTLSENERKKYEENLNVSGNGIMCYVEIPDIDIILPVYHGTTEDVLQRAAGHLDWTSLPVGGKGTHSVISGHRGLPSARLFTDLDKLKEGNVFKIHILDEELCYEIDSINIIDPKDTSILQIDKDKDLCTLMTCTPYAINTHRLCVRGHRIDDSDYDNLAVSSEAIRIDPLMVAIIMAIPLIVTIFVILLVSMSKKRKSHTKD